MRVGRCEVVVGRKGRMIDLDEEESTPPSYSESGVPRKVWLG
jgi:hypothetical protein